jgi:hypothetical protein
MRVDMAGGLEPGTGLLTKNSWWFGNFDQISLT